MSDDTPGSWNATLSRGPKARTVRKSPEGSSNVVDSGFSTEAKDVSSGASTLGGGSPASNGGGQLHQQQKMVLGQAHPPPLDVRWDTWENGVPGVTAAAAASAGPAATGSAGGGEDELLQLLDVIHRKTVRLRREFESKVSALGDNHISTCLTPAEL